MDIQGRATAAEEIVAQRVDEEILAAPFRVRVPETLESDVDRIEAFFRGQGFRHANRSHILRVAIERLVRDVYAEYPEINKGSV